MKTNKKYFNPGEIATRRKQLGLSQTELAKKIGTTQETISRWETGKTQMQYPIMLDQALKFLEKLIEK